MTRNLYKKERDPQFEDRWVDTYGACAYMSVTLPWLYQQVAKGNLPYSKINDRMLRFKLSELEKFMEQNRVMPEEASVSSDIEEAAE